LLWLSFIFHGRLQRVVVALAIRRGARKLPEGERQWLSYVPNFYWNFLFDGNRRERATLEAIVELPFLYDQSLDATATKETAAAA
jgi:hypothetical protein